MSSGLNLDAVWPTLHDLLASVFDSHPRIRAHQVLNRADDYLVLLLTLEQPTRDLIVKLAGPNATYAASFAKTAFIHQLLQAKIRVPVAEIIASDETMQHWPWRYLIQSRLEGQPWYTLMPQLDSSQQAMVYAQLGEAVAELHRLVFPGFGEISADGTILKAASFLPALRARAALMIRSPRLVDVFLSVLEPRASLFDDVDKPRLTHEDLHGGNLLLRMDGDRVTLSGILDFDKAWAGHSEIDLARLMIWRNMTSPEFARAYRRHRPITVDQPERLLLYQLLWCFEYAVNTPEHLADTQAVCNRLGLPPLQSFTD